MWLILAESVTLAYNNRNERGKWGPLLGSSQAQASMTDIIGMSFIPLYKVVGPFLFILSMLMMVWGGSRLTVKIVLRVATYKVLWVWSLGVCRFLGDVVSASSLPIQLNQQSHGRCW